MKNKMKKTLTSAIFTSAATLAFAAFAPGTYEGAQTEGLSIAAQTSDSSWIFNEVEFGSAGDFNLSDSNSGADYEIRINSSSTDVTNFRVQRKGDSSTNVVLSGTADKSASINMTQTWAFYINASNIENSTALNRLALSGYAEISAQHMCISSDAGFVSGTAIVDISGASNSLNISNDSYINSTSSATRNVNSYFNISGLSGAKSAANFANLTVRGEGVGVTEINMKGYADFKTSKFELARNTYGDASVKFEMSNSNNSLNSAQLNVGGNASGGNIDFIVGGENNSVTCTNFYLASDASGGEVEFVIGGKNNSFKATENSYIGSIAEGSNLVSFKVEGSENDVTFEKGLNIRTTGDNPASRLIFQADANGLSALNANTLSFDGLLEIDMSEFKGDAEGGIYTVSLISSAGSWNGADFEAANGNTENVAFTMGGNGESWEITFSENALQLTYTYGAVPEPAACAAIFAALALGLALWRRRS